MCTIFQTRRCKGAGIFLLSCRYTILTAPLLLLTCTMSVMVMQVWFRAVVTSSKGMLQMTTSVPFLNRSRHPVTPRCLLGTLSHHSSDFCVYHRGQSTHTCRNLSLTSLMMTSWPASSPAVAMPLPMSPPPMTATLRTLRGFRPASVTPFTFLVDLWAKKMCTKALCVSRDAAFAKASCS